MDCYISLYKPEHANMIQGFECESDFFKEYIWFNSYIDKKKGLGTTHVLIKKIISDNNCVEKLIGFYTLKATSVLVDSPTLKAGFPAMEITQIAVHKDYVRKGFGKMMIKDAIGKAFILNNEHLGVNQIVLCSVENSVDFYKKLGFKLLLNGCTIPRENWNGRCIPMQLHIHEHI